MLYLPCPSPKKTFNLTFSFSKALVVFLCLRVSHRYIYISRVTEHSGSHPPFYGCISYMEKPFGYHEVVHTPNMLMDLMKTALILITTEADLCCLNQYVRRK